MALTDYIQIEYIESDGVAYINLGNSARPTRNWSISAITQMPISSTYYLWGVNDGSSHYYDFGFNIDQNAYLWRCATSTNRYVDKVFGDPSATPVPFSYSQKIMIDQDRPADTSENTRISVYDWPDDNTEYYTTREYPNAATAVKNLYLFARNSNGTVASKAPAGTRLYSFQVVNYFLSSEEQLIMSLTPIREKNGTRVGLYDTVNDTAIWAATSNFIAGPDIGSASKLWIRQSGSWNSGTPYIRQSGSWTAGTPYIRQSGSWNQGS